jgi:uncharacterized membrane protein
MVYKCIVNGGEYPESEGILWNDLRPSVQQYLSATYKVGGEAVFVSYAALSTLFRSYIADMTATEAKEHLQLTNRVQQKFAKDQTLQPLLDDTEQEKLSFGDRLADKIAEFGGSWPFIIIFFMILVVWMLINAWFLGNKGFDPYPFILLNLVLSCLAAVQAPIIMMSQNRQAEKDRKRSEYDYKVNLKAETEVRLLHEKIDHLLTHQTKNMMEIFQLQIDVMEQLQDRWSKLAHKDAK